MGGSRGCLVRRAVSTIIIIQGGDGGRPRPRCDTGFEKLQLPLHARGGCRFPKLMSHSHLKCHPNVINDKKVGKTRLVDLSFLAPRCRPSAADDIVIPRFDGYRMLPVFDE